MSATATRLVYNDPGLIDTIAAWLLALLWILPLAYAVWTAFHPTEFSTRFALVAPLTLDNFSRAWSAAPFARYFVNTALLVAMILACQLVLSGTPEDQYPGAELLAQAPAQRRVGRGGPAPRDPA